MSEITNLNPNSLWKIFYDLTQIPRPSKKEGKAVEFAKEFGEKLGLETLVDKTGNVIIKKPATPGFEDRMGVILQAHLDMVPQKNSDKDHDFEKDPIETMVDGEWVTANGTTLGADNGIGVAAALAVISSDKVEHGPVEVLLTVDEETGMTGAFSLEKGMLDGKILLNLDSEDEGELYIGCAGGINTSGKLAYKEENVSDACTGFKIEITGLKGGHSGLDINLGRGNANKLMNRFLWEAQDKLNIRVSSIKGGSLRNAIPRESFAWVSVPKESKDQFLKMADEFNILFKNEFRKPEPGLVFSVKETECPEKVMDLIAQQNMISMVYGIPNGVMRMSTEMEGVVETSTNLAIVNVEGGEVSALCLIRSSVDTAKLSVSNMTQAVMELAGAEVTHDGNYPGWKPDVNSPVLSTMKKVYHQKYNQTPEVKVIHAGLECGIIGDAYPGLDMISFGPTIRFPHSPDEKVNIKTVEKFYEFLLETLKFIPTV